MDIFLFLEKFWTQDFGQNCEISGRMSKGTTLRVRPTRETEVPEEGPESPGRGCGLEAMDMSQLLEMDFGQLRANIDRCLGIIKVRTMKEYSVHKKITLGKGDMQAVAMCVKRIDDIVGLMERLYRDKGKEKEGSRLEGIIARMDDRMEKMEANMMKLIEERNINKERRTKTTHREVEPRPSTSADDTSSWAEAVRGGARNRESVRGPHTGATSGISKRKQWILPDTRKELIVQAPESTGKEAFAKVRSVLTHREMGESAMKRVRVHDNGTVVMEFRNETQKSLTLEKLKEVDGITVKEGNKYKPKVRVIGLRTEWTDEQILEDLEQQNGPIENKIKEIGRERTIKILKRYEWTGRSYLGNAILEVDHDIFRGMMKTGKINIGLLGLRVEEALVPLQCYRCCGYGHRQDKCQGEIMCYKCGSNHEGKTCTVTEYKCGNCIRRGKKAPSEVSHAANDRKCPGYVRRMEELRNKTDYGDTDPTN